MLADSDKFHDECGVVGIYGNLRRPTWRTLGFIPYSTADRKVRVLLLSIREMSMLKWGWDWSQTFSRNNVWNGCRAIWRSATTVTPQPGRAT